MTEPIGERKIGTDIGVFAVPDIFGGSLPDDLLDTFEGRDPKPMTSVAPGRQHQARALWQRIETLHAVTYFADECLAANRDLGLRGFWMGYFASRAAPLGAIGPAPVTAIFANFAPRMVERALPDAWGYATPGDIVQARAAAAADALRRLVGDIDDVADHTGEALRRAADAGSPLARPLGAANRDLPTPADPVARLWQWSTTLREYRGDGHVAALAASGINGCEAHLLLAAHQGVPASVFLQHRGWTNAEVSDANRRLQQRDLLGDDGLTADGKVLRRQIEAVTDDRAADALSDALSSAELDELIDAPTPAATAAAQSGTLPFPNPMGLPPLSERLDDAG